VEALQEDLDQWLAYYIQKDHIRDIAIRGKDPWKESRNIWKALDTMGRNTENLFGF